jgi:Transposase
MQSAIAETPDIYLDELRLELQEVCGVSVSLSTIWRTLVKSGYSMKKVRNSCHLQFPTLDRLTDQSGRAGAECRSTG